MKKKMLKKSEVLREGYVKGLKHAQSIINEMLNKSESYSIDEYFAELNSQYENAEENSWYNGEFDNEYFEQHSPSIMIESGNDVVFNETLESAYYDSNTDEATFEAYPNGKTVVIPDFSRCWASRETQASNVVLKNVVTDLYYDDNSFYTVTLFRM